MTVWWIWVGLIGLLLVLGLGVILWALTQTRRGRRPRPPKPKKPLRKGQYDDQGYDRDGYGRDGYNRQGYDRQGYGRDGYNGQGYDRRGYDRDGFDRCGYDSKGYDRQGYNRQGYTIHGRDARGRYNRLYDMADFLHAQYSAEGFLDPRRYPVGVTQHGVQRMHERMPGNAHKTPLEVAREAYCFGKSARQIRTSSVYLVREIEEREGTGVVLIYHGYIYIFSRDNQLITVYKNERIPL